jgi:hypothetical protein
MKPTKLHIKETHAAAEFLKKRTHTCDTAAKL